MLSGGGSRLCEGWLGFLGLVGFTPYPYDMTVIRARVDCREPTQGTQATLCPPVLVSVSNDQPNGSRLLTSCPDLTGLAQVQQHMRAAGVALTTRNNQRGNVVAFKPGDPNNPGFRPGVSGNPAGRPKGARSRLGEAFLDAVLDDFAEHGMDAIRRVCEDDPGAYLRIIASLLPREVTAENGEPLFQNVTITFVNADAKKSGVPSIRAA